MNPLTRLLVSFLGGELVTLLTGVIPNTPAMLVGATHYGYPLPWLTRLIIAPQYNPWRVDMLGFLGDTIIWFIIVAIVLFILDRGKKAS